MKRTKTMVLMMGLIFTSKLMYSQEIKLTFKDLTFERQLRTAPLLLKINSHSTFTHSFFATSFNRLNNSSLGNQKTGNSPFSKYSFKLPAINLKPTHRPIYYHDYKGRKYHTNLLGTKILAR